MRNTIKTCVTIFTGTLLFLAALAGCSTNYELYMKLAKGSVGGGSFTYEGNVSRWSSPEAMVEASYLSPAGADLYFSLFKDGRYKNPFPPKACMVFSLLVENRGKAAITYDPRMTRLYPESGDPVMVKDFSAMYVDLDMAKAEGLDERMKAFKEACFDVAVTLQPGEKVQRLLVYPRGKDYGDKVALVVEGFYVDRAPRTVPLLFSGVSAE